MALKKWIDDIKTAEGELESGAQLELGSALDRKTSIIRCADYPLPGELEADKILFAARDEIVKCGVYYWKTPATQDAEAAVNRAHKAILDGGSGFDALRDACALWIKTAKTPPAGSATASLFQEPQK